MTTATNTKVFYLIIGSGRVARHMAHYFHQLNIHFESWDRSQDPHVLARKVSSATHVLLAISDQALEGFYRQHLLGHDKVVVHFSGAHHFPEMIAAHPLMTFGATWYELALYKKIHFVLTGSTALAEALPGLPNSFSPLPAEQKSLYHAYCVLGGNFVTLLINKMLEGLSSLNIPPEAAEVYVQQTVQNTLAQSHRALTGPLARKDVQTVQKNIEALTQDPYQQIYQAFLQVHWPDYPRKDNHHENRS
ncbi:MAG: DUF2520 domain-containing protein [Bdellovibrio sp.]